MSKSAMSSSSSAAIVDDESRIKCMWAVSKNANLYIQPVGANPIKVGRITGGRYTSKHKSSMFDTLQKVCIVTVTDCVMEESQDLDSSVSEEPKNFILLEKNFQLAMSHTTKSGNRNSIELDKKLCDRFVKKSSTDKGRWFRKWVETEATATQEQSYIDTSPVSPINSDNSDNDDDEDEGEDQLEILGEEHDYGSVPSLVGPRNEVDDDDMLEYMAGSQASVTGTQTLYIQTHT